MAVARNISVEAVLRKTGKASADWYQTIDKFGTTNHTEVAKILRDQYNLNPWWAQIVTNRWEWERGLRDK